MKTILLTAALIALAAPTLADATWSGTGPRGGSYSGSGSCAAEGGALSCQRSTTATNPYGQTVTRSGTRLTTESGTTKTFVTTGPRGNTATSTRVRNR